MTDGQSLESPTNACDALSKSQRLTREQLVEIRSRIAELGPQARDRYWAELLLLLGDDLVSVHTALEKSQGAIKEFDASARSSMQEVRGTIERFDQASRRLTRWLIGLTIVLVVLTLAITIFTILLWSRPH